MSNKTNIPILITGTQRSGSTMIAKILRSSGVFTGSTSGMSENLAIKRILDTWYKSKQWDVKGQFPLPINPQMPDGIYSQILEVLRNEGYMEGMNWLIKGHRIGQTWKVWNEMFPNAKWIIVRRRTGDVIHSCLKTAYMYEYHSSSILKKIGVSSPEEGWLWWVRKQEECYNEMITAGIDYRVIWPERMARDDYEQIEELHKWIGIDYDAEQIRELISPMMTNSVQKRR